MDDPKAVLMGFCWHDFEQTGDKMALVHALRMADFFGHPKIQEKIEEILILECKLKGAGLRRHGAKSVAQSMFSTEMQKPNATKERAYQAIGSRLKMEPSAVRMMLKRRKSV